MPGDILSPTHLLFVLVVALLVLGPKRLPEVGRTLGSGIRDFRHALSGDESPQRPQRPEPQWVEAPAEPATYPQYEQHYEPETEFATVDAESTAVVDEPGVAHHAAVAREPVPTDAPPALMLTPQPPADAEPATASSTPAQPTD